MAIVNSSSMSEQTTYKAQFGEDKILADYFGHKTEGFYVEVGAYDGVRMSNSYHFEHLGWEGILVEADPELADQCRASRPRATVVNCAVVSPEAPPVVTFQVSDDWKSLSSLSFNKSRRKEVEHLTGDFKVSEVSVPGKTLDSIFAEHAIERVDFLTIDVEGHEWDVLQGFTISRWKPEIVIIERNTLLPDLRIARYMFRNGYRYLRTTGVNDWFGPPPSPSAGRFGNLSYFAATFYVVRPVRLGYRGTKKRLQRSVRSVLDRVGLLGPVRRLLGRSHDPR